MQVRSFRTGALVLFVTLMLMGLAASIQPADDYRVQAQIEAPTATPSDPIWLGFSISRDALEEAEGVDLTFVRQWQFYQDDWSRPNAAHPENAAGIDSCVSTVSIQQGRPIYFGLTYEITATNGNQYMTRVSFDLQDVVICDIFEVSSASGGDEATDEAVVNPDLPQPVAGAGAGGSFELGGHVDGLSQQAVDAMNRSGMTWVKKQIRTEAGVQAGINAINDARGKGFKILLGVVGSKDAVAADPVGYRATYSDFVAQLAAAGADAIEVWNEPNIDREWPADQISGANYTALLADAFNAIKSANPNTIVISGAPAPTGFFGAAGCGAGGCNDDVFMQQMANAGASSYMDCIGLHYNEGIVSPGTFSGDPRGEYPTYYFGSMTQRGQNAFPGKPVCYTELGYLSPEGMGGPLPGGFAWASETTVAEHAAWLADAAARSAQSNVRLMIVWNVNFTRYDSDPMGGYAMIRPDGTCPACSQLGTVMGN